MASLDAAARQHKEALPSIDNLDFEKYRFEQREGRHTSMTGLSSIGIPRSPTSAYSLPPPPYSAGGSKPQSLSGYMSPAQSTSRRSTRDEKESPLGTTSLPSISEALKSTEMNSTPQSYTQQSIPAPNPLPNIANAPRGPGNPFSQSANGTSTMRPPFFSGIDASNTITSLPPPPVPPDNRTLPSALVSSPRLSTSSIRSSTSHHSGGPAHESIFPPPFSGDSPSRSYSYSELAAKSAAQKTPHIKQKSKLDDPHTSFNKTTPPRPYHETIKRHLEVYDAELALKELMENSARTHEFASSWSQRYHQSNRTSYINEGLPGTADVDEMLQVTHRMLDNLTKLRDVSVVQETALSEQRARMAQGSIQENDPSSSDDFRSGGFAGGDAKKRRGKAAPPGRCHSCNRAETPEWRRGPDGARTLCNACGLHYAKLTRKMGANKAAVMTGSNLRPKTLADTRP